MCVCPLCLDECICGHVCCMYTDPNCPKCAYLYILMCIDASAPE